MPRRTRSRSPSARLRGKKTLPAEDDPMRTKARPVAKPVDELKAIRRSLQDAGLTLLKAATVALGAAANETLSATKTVIAP
jgi:hypothetical protein